MWLHPKRHVSRSTQRGQVLAEAVVVMLMLIILIWALHQSGRWQYAWSTDWLKTQVTATAWSLDHVVSGKDLSISPAERDVWRNWVMADFGLGQVHWHTLNRSGRFAKKAWRLGGVGQASEDQAVTAKIRSAPRLWLKQALVSQTTAGALLPSIKAVDMPWRDRGSATDWLGQWQGSTPSAYLGEQP